MSFKLFLVIFFSVLSTVLACQMSLIPAEFEVSETIPVESILYNFTTTGVGTPGITTSGTSFVIETFGPNNFGLKLKKQLLYSSQRNTEKVEMMCSNPNDSSDISFGDVVVLIKDEDNNPPKFVKDSYRVTIREDVAKMDQSLTISQLQATDINDDLRNQIINYTIVADYGNASFFRIRDPDTSLVTMEIAKDLDYELSSEYKVKIKASDYQKNINKLKFETTTIITVTVTDVDDTRPVFNIADPSSYTATVVANVTLGTVVETEPVNLKAVDGDRSIDTPIGYRLQIPDDIFALNNETGEITLKSTQPAPGTKFLLIEAFQKNKPEDYTQATVKITIIPAVDLPPKFTQDSYETSVYENLTPGEKIASVKAEDQISLKEQTKKLKYELHNDLSTFNLRPSANGELGEVFLNDDARLDYEKVKSYKLRISATDENKDGGTPFTEFTELTVTVKNVNDNDPIFVNKTFDGGYSFKTQRVKGTKVGKVRAIDYDDIPDNAVKYSLTDKNEFFEIDENTGEITIVAENKDLTAEKYEIGVQARDKSDSPRKSFTKVIVEFTDAKPVVANAMMQMWPFIIIGVILLLILICAILAIICFRKRSADKGKNIGDGRASSLSYDYNGGATSLQENPIEGYDNFQYGDDDGLDLGIYRADRDVSEIHLSETYPDANDYSTSNGSIRTVSGTSSFMGSRQNLVPNGNTLPKKMRLNNNLEVVQADNAIEAASVVDSTTGNGMNGLTVYF